MNKIFIDIPYVELKKAIEDCEKKKGICKILPHGRFTFDFVKDCGYNVRRVEEADGNEIKYGGLVCEALGGKSTGTSASSCKNCVIDKCKHENTVKEECNEKDCPDKEHEKCLECGALIDLIIVREENLKKAKELLTELERKEEG